MNNSKEGARREEVLSFIEHLVFGRWFTMFASFFIMAGAGGTYLFAFYSKDIKAALGCDQTTLNLISFYKDLGSNVGIFSGLLAEVTPTWFVLLVGALLNFLGYFKIWQAVTGKIGKPTVGFICFYILVGANSQHFASTGALVTCVKNFPERRGAILGLLKGFVGLSGAIITPLHLAINGNDSKSLILLLAWLPTLISLVFVCTVQEVKGEKTPKEFGVFFQFLYVSTILALFLAVIIIIQRRVPFNESTEIASVIVIFTLLFLPLLIIVREEMAVWRLKKRSTDNPFTRKRIEVSESQKALTPRSTPTPQESKHKTSNFANIFNKPERGENYTILQAIFSIDMLIIFITTSIGVGSNMTAMDNLGQIGESLRYSREIINTFISLASIFNFFGGIFSGFVSEILLAKYRFPRPLMLTFILLLTSLGHLAVVLQFPGSIYIASVITGFSLGSQIPLMFAIISEIFGLKHFSTLFNFGQLAYPIGSYILNVMITGKFYDQGAKAKLYVESGKLDDCMGNHCYSKAFMILSMVTLIGSLVSMILVKRTREFYRGDIYKAFKEDLDSLKTEMEFYQLEERRNRF